MNFGTIEQKIHLNTVNNNIEKTVVIQASIHKDASKKLEKPIGNDARKVKFSETVKEWNMILMFRYNNP